ncbi:Pimeloyl-ACP methyl ester carboxylesterase [Pseudonocardia thermophila]|uniref:Pimeloyl-ACP methyl ester carboxylesterase n=1 Tax=Pseudonocardia thermophila TaxID=1848 RepID=A0A1M6YHU2_PSETH|nr:alpha/beta hydrolase [Pseudonocardia thermophila]SHL17826.1 Pimeloyl-ACP methyl ester carboxylesterase [Pseudonocardia thermophila]
MHTLSRPGGVLAFDDDGPDGPAPLLFVHGMPFDRTMWRDHVDRYAAERRVIVPDLRGFGRSSGPPASWAGYADDLATLLADRRVPPAVVVGFSMGGLVALDLQDRYPHLVAGLALVDTTAGPDPDPAARHALADRLEREGMDPYTVETLYRMVRPDCSERIVEHVLAMMRDADPAGVAAAHRLRAWCPDHRDRLAGIAVPTAVIVGADDELTPLPAAEELAQIPGAELTVVERAAHMPPVERPDVFAAALDRLLARVDRRVRPAA